MTDAYEDEGPGLTQIQDLLIDSGAMNRRVVAERDDEKDLQRAQQIDEATQQAQQHLSLEEIDDILEGKSEETGESEEIGEDVLERLRRQRLEKLEEQKSHIRAADAARRSATNGERLIRSLIPQQFQTEVLDASASCPNDFILMAVVRGDEHKESEQFLECLRVLAVKFPKVKFVRIEASTHSIGVPPSHAPVLLAYSNGRKIHQWKFAGEPMSADIVEWQLKQVSIVESELEEDPKEKETRNKKIQVLRKGKQNKNQSKKRRKQQHSDNDDDDDDDDD